jgi:hypothetical protein
MVRPRTLRYFIHFLKAAMRIAELGSPSVLPVARCLILATLVTTVVPSGFTKIEQVQDGSRS